MSWGNASSWENSWGKAEALTDAEMIARYQKGQTSRAKSAGAADVASGLAQLTNIGVQVGELISTNNFQKRLLREKKKEASNARFAARRQAKFRRTDQARASMLQQRLSALTAITGARTQKALIAGIGIVVLAAVFLIATKAPKPKQQIRSQI
jgi:hypothetical protein